MRLSAGNSGQTYGWVAITLHWLMALAVVLMFASGWWMTGLDYYDAWYHRAPALHAAAGVVLLLLLLFRFAWRLGNPRPALRGAWWEQKIALIVHYTHYLLLSIVILAGYLLPTAQGRRIDVFGLFQLPALLELNNTQQHLAGQLHWWGACAAITLAVLHGVAALKHHFVDKDDTLLRMLGLAPVFKEDDKE